MNRFINLTNYYKSINQLILNLIYIMIVNYNINKKFVVIHDNNI
jgi:hypothetical protein